MLAPDVKPWVTRVSFSRLVSWEWPPENRKSSSSARRGELNRRTPRLAKLRPPENAAAHWPEWNGVVSLTASWAAATEGRASDSAASLERSENTNGLLKWRPPKLLRQKPAATLPASTKPTTTLVSAEPRCSTVAHIAPRPDASRTRPASENETSSMPIMVPSAHAAK